MRPYSISRLASGVLLSAIALGHARISVAQVKPAVPDPTEAERPVPGKTVKIDVRLKGYVFGFRMMKASYSGYIEDGRYSVRADLYTSGLGALLKKFRIWATTTGVIGQNDLRPLQHIQQNEDKKHRRVEMNYKSDRVDVKIVPRLGSLGKPPATEKQKFESEDTLSAMLNLMMRGYRFTQKPCTGKIAVFDSKQHYYLRLQPDGHKQIRQKGFKGDTLRCKVYYEAVSGYDPEDLPSREEAGTPVTVYLARYDQAGLYVPVRMKYKISSISATIKARDIRISVR